jgi:hypothetical protein
LRRGAAADGKGTVREMTAMRADGPNAAWPTPKEDDMPGPAIRALEQARAYWGDDTGQDLSEYAFLLSLLALAIIVLLFNFRDTIAKVIGQARDCLNAVETNDPGTCPG